MIIYPRGEYFFSREIEIIIYSAHVQITIEISFVHVGMCYRHILCYTAMKHSVKYGKCYNNINNRFERGRFAEYKGMTLLCAGARDCVGIGYNGYTFLYIPLCTHLCWYVFVYCTWQNWTHCAGGT